MDRRSLRKLNQSKNHADSSLSEDPKGSVTRRDRNTGNREIRLDNGGIVQARPLFHASINTRAKVQLNVDTNTADWKSVNHHLHEQRRRKRRANQWEAEDDGRDDGNRLPTFIDTTDDDDNNPDNPAIGKCPVCSGNAEKQIDCKGGDAKITFTDNTVEYIQTPAVLTYGARATFEYTDGTLGSIDVDTCANASIDSDIPETLNRPISGFGSLMFRKVASAVNIGGISVANIAEFHLYKDGCAVTLVTFTNDGTSTVQGEMECNEAFGTYTELNGKTSLTFGDKTAYDIDPDTVSFDCVIKGYRFCQKYTLTWTGSNQTKEYKIENCTPIGYQLKSANQARFTPPARPIAGYSLKFNSGIPRVFTVSDGVNVYPTNKGYFQIYQNNLNQCEYDIVGVEVGNDGYTYETIYTGPCGFEITLGGNLSETFLQVFDAFGTLILQTDDYLPGSIRGCEFLGGSGNNAAFVGECQSAILDRVLVFEKSLIATDNNPIDIADVSCQA